MKKRKDKGDIQLSKKRLILRIVLFALAVAVAIAGFALWATSSRRKAPGYHRIDANANDEQLLLNSQIDFQYAFSGSGAAINAEIKQLQGVYGEALQQASRLLDAEHRWPGLANLATLNASQDEDILLSPELFAVLTDAWEKTQEKQGYNMFAGPLYAEWNSILVLQDPQDFDPRLNREQASRIARLAEAVNNPDNFRFTVVDAEKCAVRFSVSETVTGLMEELELDCPVLDLNVLHDAYLLRLIAAQLEEQGYQNGYLAAESGITAALSGQTEGDYRLYGMEESPVPAAKAKVSGGSAFCAWRTFAGQEDDFWFYTVTDGEKTLFRHPYFTASGEHPQALRSASCFDGGGDTVACAYACLRILASADAASAAETAEKLSLPMAWTLAGDGTKTVSINAPGAAVFLEEDYGWRLAS